jgi:tetratricopeptide (TPR) repeat protein
MKLLFPLFLLAFGLLSVTLPKGERIAPDASFGSTISKEAAPDFEKAMLLLHNFEYDDATELFIKVQEKDPGNVMAYWGEAMTYDHPVWGDLDIEKARGALKKLGSTPEERASKAKSELDRDLIKAADILFGEGSKPDRQKKYADFMGTIYKKYPGDIEVTAFYCLSLLGIKKGWNEWEEQNVQAAKLAKDILKKAPDHAGALHYLVHANDHPLYAKNGLDAANRYAVAASYAGHALHMPSHIYLALGMWDDVVRSNEVAWKASTDRVERKKLSVDELSYHSHLWLQYGYLQQGRYTRAREVLEQQVRYTQESPSAVARVHLLQMIGHYLYETNDWNSSLAETPVKTEDIMISSQFNYALLQGYRAFKKQDGPMLDKIIAKFEEDLKSYTQVQKANENMTICGVTRYVSAIPTEQEIQIGNKRLKTLKGLSAWLRNDLTEADKYLKESLPKEGTVVLGPPFGIIPSREIYGDFLLSLNKPEEAYEQFEKALEASPNRIASLKGQLKAAKQMSNRKKEEKARKSLTANLKNADTNAIQDL